MANVIFNENTGVEVPDTLTVRTDIENGFKSAFQTNPDLPVLNTDPVTPMGQVIDLITAEAEAKNTEVAFLCNMMNILTATGRFLDALASLYGLTRKISESTIVNCTCYGLKGTVIPYGAIVEDVNGNQYRMNVANGITIGNSGEINGTFASLEKTDLVVTVNSVNKIITAIPGWESVNNQTSGVTGRVKETDAELRNRVYSSYAINSTGSVESLESNLAQLSGVIDVAVLENYTNNPVTKYGVGVHSHSIAVCISGGEDNDIASVIYARKDVGCGTTGSYSVTYIDTNHSDVTYTYKIIRPTNTDFFISLSLFTDSMTTEQQNEIKQKLIQDFLGQLNNDRVKLASEVFASRFYQCVQSVTDVPIQEILINLDGDTPSQHVTINADVEPVLSADNISISFVG